MSETPELQWFEQIPTCSRCGKLSQGRLMGRMNQSFGWHCLKCANKRLVDSHKVREAERKSHEADRAFKEAL